MQEKEGKIIFIAFLSDRLSKYLAGKSNLFLMNKGAFFGFINNYNAVFLLSILVIIFLFFLKRRYRLPTRLITIGGISNLFDRVVYKGVVDFIRLPFMPVFNFADVFICLGALLIVVDLLKSKQL